MATMEETISDGTDATRDTDARRDAMWPHPQVAKAVKQYWGFTDLRPLQAEAIDAGIRCRDALVVMPTGGGKSLCYQVPPLIAGRTDIVVSPLISLMKDQVDALQASGYPAATIHSGMEPAERLQVERDLLQGGLRLLFVSPERLMMDSFLTMLGRIDPRSFAIDEAHCISQWGHDFRPEYRQLAALRHRFPQASLHAFTATATPDVRRDIIAQLALHDPLELVGDFDRPNLVYRILPQVDLPCQVLDVVQRHRDEAVIIYCLSRAETESLAETLMAQGIEAACYHAGLDADQRHQTQERFALEQLNVVVATVAFGMGIDRSNVRCVLHATMPKSVEHYQQEAGRAGRDGLEAECVLLYSAADVMRWKSLIRASAEEHEQADQIVAVQDALIQRMQRLCNSHVCRHKTLCEYFGQPYDHEQCGACDVCLNEVENLEDASVAAQKILSCVARTGQRYGIGHVVDVLLGANTQQIRRCGHDELSTYALMADTPKKTLVSLVYQLVDQGALARTDGDRPILCLTERSLEVMRGQSPVRLMRPRQTKDTRTAIDHDAWDGVDRGLFEHLRGVRRQWAATRGVPPYVVFEDSTLRMLARVRPASDTTLRAVRGIGDRRATDFGPALIDTISTFCQAHDLDTDVISLPPPPRTGKGTRGRRNAQKEAAFEMFSSGRSITEVASATGRAVSTTTSYLAQWIAEHRPVTIDTWVNDETYQRVVEAAAANRGEKLGPLFHAMDARVPYETIRLVLTHTRLAPESTRGDEHDPCTPGSSGAARRHKG